MACCCGERERAAKRNDNLPLETRDDSEPMLDEGRGDENVGTKFDYDENFRGPVKSRSCTDLPCLLLFILALVVLGFVGAFAFRHGNPKILLRSTDSEGNICGYGRLAGRPYVFYFDLLECATAPAALVIKGCGTPQVCVDACPDTLFLWHLVHEKEVGTNYRDEAARRRMICRFGVDPVNSHLSIKALVDARQCAAYYMPSADFYYRCVPSVGYLRNLSYVGESKNVTDYVVADGGKSYSFDRITKVLSKLGKIFQTGGFFEKVMHDLLVGANYIIMGIFCGAVLAFMWMMVLELFACLFVYVTLVAFFALFLFVTAYTFYQYTLATEEVDWSNLILSKNKNYYLKFKETWLFIGIGSSVVTAIVFLILMGLGQQIRLSISILGEATKAVAQNISTLFFPVIPWLLWLLSFALWFLIAIFLASSGKPQFAYGSNDSVDLKHCKIENNITDKVACYFMSYSGDDWAFYLQMYNIFVGLWLTCFCMQFGNIVLAGVFATWYWENGLNRRQKTFRVSSYCLLIRSIFRALRYHLGSLAFGSLMIATVRFATILLSFLQRNLAGSENPVAKFFFSVLRCLFYCLDNFLRYMCNKAFIMMAIHGATFCSSARSAFFLIVRNVLRTAVLNCVVDFVLFVGRMLVTAVIVFLAILFFNGAMPYTEKVVPTFYYAWVPIVFIGIGTWIVASMFFSVFSFCVDTLFLCVMEDLERNDGSLGRPYFMGENLKSVLGLVNDK